MERSTGGLRTLTLLSLYIPLQKYRHFPAFRCGVVRRVLNENEIAEESSGESSTKTKSWRSRPASSQRKRNRGGVVGRVLNENEIVEESSSESSMMSPP